MGLCKRVAEQWLAVRDGLLARDLVFSLQGGAADTNSICPANLHQVQPAAGGERGLCQAGHPAQPAGSRPPDRGQHACSGARCSSCLFLEAACRARCVPVVGCVPLPGCCGAVVHLWLLHLLWQSLQAPADVRMLLLAGADPHRSTRPRTAG